MVTMTPARADDELHLFIAGHVLRAGEHICPVPPRDTRAVFSVCADPECGEGQCCQEMVVGLAESAELAA